MNHEKLDQIIEKSFKTEPEYHLPVHFAQMTTSVIIRKTQWLADLYEYLYLTIVAVILLGMATAIYYLVNKEFLLQIVTFISRNTIPFAMMVMMLNFILFADRVLLRLLFSRWKRT